MPAPSTHPHLHGWGYQGRSVDDLVAFARSTGSRVVVDVRLNPISRRRGFSKRALQAALDAEGIGYVHLPGLGNPRDNRAGFAHPDTPGSHAARTRYRDEVLGAPLGRDGLRRLASLAEHDDVVVLCYESDEATCHRELVLRSLDAARQPVPA